MAEYLIQDTTLTGIADKIRPLLGLTGTMTPEQMQTNLTTEQANITAALAALAEKGVEVPEGANSNALAGLIAAIEAGGGELVINGLNAVCGTFTVAEDVTSGYYIIECSRVSYGYNGRAYSIFYAIDGQPAIGEAKYMVAGLGTSYLTKTGYDETGVYMVSAEGSSSLTTNTLGNSYVVNTSNGKLTIEIYTGSYPLLAGTTYGWIAMSE